MIKKLIFIVLAVLCVAGYVNVNDRNTNAYKANVGHVEKI